MNGLQHTPRLSGYIERSLLGKLAGAGKSSVRSGKTEHHDNVLWINALCNRSVTCMYEKVPAHESQLRVNV